MIIQIDSIQFSLEAPTGVPLRRWLAPPREEGLPPPPLLWSPPPIHLWTSYRGRLPEHLSGPPPPLPSTSSRKINLQINAPWNISFPPFSQNLHFSCLPFFWKQTDVSNKKFQVSSPPSLPVMNFTTVDELQE